MLAPVVLRDGLYYHGVCRQIYRAFLRCGELVHAVNCVLSMESIGAYA